MKFTGAGNLKISKQEFEKQCAEVAVDTSLRHFRHSKDLLEAVAYIEISTIFATELVHKLFDDKEE